MDQRLTPNFWLSELMVSDYAIRFSIPNVPPPPVLVNMRKTLAPGLQRARGVLNCPMLISSAYRSPALNKAVGGSPKSQHMEGLAADFTAPGFGSPIKVCRKLLEELDTVNFDQLIQEGRWVHVSFAEPGVPPRGEVLTAQFGPGGATYRQGLA
jgi:zinc D-Ala-D-Ala carboxypeptidase